jgi:hypothetical protein
LVGPSKTHDRDSDSHFCPGQPKSTNFIQRTRSIIVKQNEEIARAELHSTSGTVSAPLIIKIEITLNIPQN